MHAFFNNHIKNLLDGASITTMLATLLGWLPHVAAILSIIWTGIRIWETPTVQKWAGKHLKKNDDEVSSV